jgi:hypothetical protein
MFSNTALLALPILNRGMRGCERSVVGGGPVLSQIGSTKAEQVVEGEMCTMNEWRLASN